MVNQSGGRGATADVNDWEKAAKTWLGPKVRDG